MPARSAAFLRRSAMDKAYCIVDCAVHNACDCGLHGTNLHSVALTDLTRQYFVPATAPSEGACWRRTESLYRLTTLPDRNIRKIVVPRAVICSIMRRADGAALRRSGLDGYEVAMLS
jgi:hypothetical protein